MNEPNVAVIGLGYVGLPLALEFGKKFSTVGFDVNPIRIEQLVSGVDNTNECSQEKILNSKFLTFTSSLNKLKTSDFLIVAVPTPIDSAKNPDLTALKNCCHLLGGIIKKDDIVVFESTVFPGATEEICVPILEQKSGLKYNRDFYVGYSPERINPGDKDRGICNICKITSGSTPWVAERVDEIYSAIISAGTFKAANIKVAEAAKVIENVQRDLNIALVNEFAQIFGAMGIDTNDVLDAASSKWNFANYRPGLVGGHCIGVDPYYLTFKAQELNLHPELILAGRRINERMSNYLAVQIVQLMVGEGFALNASRVLVLGATFKPNCNDIRNTKVPDMIAELEKFGLAVDIFDPFAGYDEINSVYEIHMVSPQAHAYDIIILAVPHDTFVQQGAEQLRLYGKQKHLLIDPWSAFSSEESDYRV